jgi:hypothetical protein
MPELLAIVAAILLAPMGRGVSASGGSGGGGGNSGQNTTPNGNYVLTVQRTTSNIAQSVGVNPIVK